MLLSFRSELSYLNLFFILANTTDLGALFLNATLSALQGLAKGMLAIANLTVSATLNGLDGIAKGLEKKT